MPSPQPSPALGEGRALVCWIEGGAQAQASARMANAFRDLANHDLQGAVIDAFSAFEIALFTFVNDYLTRTYASVAIRRTIEGRLCVYAMINLLPELCEELQFRPLHRLRICRNNILHKGNREVVTASHAGEGLAAALLGIAFLIYVEAHTT